MNISDLTATDKHSGERLGKTLEEMISKYAIALYIGTLNYSNNSSLEDAMYPTGAIRM